MHSLRVAAIVLGLVGLGVFAGLLLVRASHKPTAQGRVMFTNSEFIDGLYQNGNMLDVTEAFDLVFGSLDDEVTVYPSENYYYFRLYLRGRMFAGTLQLAANYLDSGKIGFGYVRAKEDRLSGRGKEPMTFTRDFGAKEGMKVEKIDDFSYALTYKEKRVRFNFFKEELRVPKNMKLAADEVYVGPCFDESGLRFAILFNKTVGKMYWVLNEEGFVPERFTAIAPAVVEGDRTEFVFYADTVHNRKILVGVSGFNVGQNNWYDGPSDQLPDNYVRTGRVNLQEYMKRHVGAAASSVDRYGNLAGRSDRRLLVMPATIYFNLEDLRFIDSVKAMNLPPARFYAAITQSRFGTPPEWKSADELEKNDSLMKLIGYSKRK